MMDQMMHFQVDFLRKYELLERRIEESAIRLEDRCNRIEKVLSRYNTKQ